MPHQALLTNAMEMRCYRQASMSSLDRGTSTFSSVCPQTTLRNSTAFQFEGSLDRRSRYFQNTIFITRMISSSGEKIVSRRGTRGAAVAAARRVTSSNQNGIGRISRTMA